MNRDKIFDLPELLVCIGSHLPTGSLYQCVQVSKSWNAAFLPHLWRTFNEDQVSKSSDWSRGLASAIRMQLSVPQHLEWYKDVFRRHAKYIRHISISTPIVLDACLQGAFEPLRRSLLPPHSSSDSGDISVVGSSGTAAVTAPPPLGDSTTSTDVAVGPSLITSLESLTVNFLKPASDFYFQASSGGPGFTSTTGFGVPSTTGFGVPSTTGFGVPSTTGFGVPSTTGFGVPSTTGFGSASNSNNSVNNNSNNSNSDATMDPATSTTTTMPPPPDVEQVFFKACGRLILNNPRLSRFSSMSSSAILQDLQGDVYGDNSALRSLKYLTCNSKDSLIPKWLPPSVTHLDLKNFFGSRYDPFSSASGSQPGRESKVVHEALESLEVLSIESPAHLTHLLDQAPNLKTLSINGFLNKGGFGSSFAIPAPVPEDKPITWPTTQITVLKCRGTRIVHDHVSGLEGFFACFPLLVEYHDDMWSNFVSTHLVKHCPLLEVIRMQESFGATAFGAASKPAPRRLESIVSDNVSVLLTGLPKLRVLNLPHESIAAGNILRRPWICFDLEELRCQIAELPFLTKENEMLAQDIRQRETAGGTSSAQQQHLTTDEEKRLLEISERCLSTRRQIMSQLSKLTSLKYLSLSPDFKIGNEIFDNRYNTALVYKSERDGRSYIRYNDVLPDTLQFRLDSGLDQLASLENLEYLSFESMDHQMGTAEIEWIARHFPRLKEMRGLVTENHIGMEPDPENDALVALLRRLRPDIVQSQSFGGYVLDAPGTTNNNGFLNGHYPTRW